MLESSRWIPGTALDTWKKEVEHPYPEKFLRLVCMPLHPKQKDRSVEATDSSKHP
jgi:hypothetical protein